MIKLTIDGKEIKVAEGTTVLNAARELGIEIPTMCYREGFHNHPSCMLCMVKDEKNGKLLPSCALPAAEGMQIRTDEEEVIQARKEALELLLSDHVGDCEAPCTLGCPAGMNIPLMNRLIANGEYREAIAVVKEDIALPHILGYICPAPCEKVCRRNSIDTSVQICQLKKFVAAADLQSDDVYYPEKKADTAKKVAIIGSGAAGMATAFYLLKAGHQCVVFDKNEAIGGYLRYGQLDKPLPVEVLDSEIEYLKSYGAEFNLNTKFDQKWLDEHFKSTYDAIVIATGSIDQTFKQFSQLKINDKGIEINPNTYETSVTGIFACGSAVKTLKMAVRAVAQGKETALSVNAFLNNQQIEKQYRMFNSKFGKLENEEFEEYLKEAPNKNLKKEIYTKLDAYQNEEAKMEAERCMHCDCRKIDNCKLRIHSDHYQVDRRKYLMGDRNPVQKHFKQNVIVYEPEKCIKCGLCVEITSLKKEEFGLTYIGRGFNVKIKAPFGKSMEEALTSTAIECAEACPTGAISRID